MDHRCEGIPRYAAELDKYCPVAQSPKFKRRVKRLKELEQDDRWGMSPKKRTLEPLPKRPPSVSRKQGGGLRLGDSLPSLPVSLSSALGGGVAYGTGDVLEKEWRAPASLDPTQELATLTSILARERYLKRLEATLNRWLANNNNNNNNTPPTKQKTSPPESIGMLFDLIRTATVEVVEQIVKWRAGLERKDAPFNWNGQNYLLKIPSDLDDLDLVRALQRYTGFSFRRNPFLLPRPLDFRNMPTSVFEEAAYRVGAAPQDNQDQDQDDDDEDDGKRCHEAPKSRGPYLTAVVNDASVLARSPKKTKKKMSNNQPLLTSQQRREASERKKPVKMTIIGLPEEEEERVREAERILLAEEAAHGRFKRNNEGRLVPEDLADRELFVAAMKVDEGRPLKEPALAGRATAAHASMAGMGHGEPDEEEELERARARFAKSSAAVDYAALEKKFLTAEEDNNSKDPFDSATSAAERIARVGGVLSEQTSATTMGRRRAPTRRTRGAALDADVARLHRENARLAKDIEDLRAETAADLAEAELLEGDADRLDRESQVRKDLLDAAENPTVEDIQRLRRGRRATQAARQRASALRDDVAKRDLKIAELEESRSLRLREAAQRTRDRLALKKSTRAETDKQLALILEKERRLLGDQAVHDLDEGVAQTLEDESAKACQRVVRGKLARLYAVKLRRIYARAATVLNAGVRGHFGRVRARFERFKKKGATMIQRHVRSRFARIVVGSMKSERRFQRSALLVGALFLGIKARRRLRRRRQLRKVAEAAREAVSVRGLFPADLYDLVEAIREAQCDHRVAFPPAAVLGLLRVVVLLLSVDDDNDRVYGDDEAFTPPKRHQEGECVTELSVIGVRRLLAVERTDLSWKGAMKVLRRAHRLLRRLRALAAGPHSNPPRLLALPRVALELFEAYAKDPTMSLEAMRRLPRGARACSQLLTFVVAIKDVYALQTFFFEDLGGDEMTPNWLVRKRLGAKRRRGLLAKALVHRHAADYAKDAKEMVRADCKRFPVEALCADIEDKDMADADDALAAHDAAEGVHAAELALRIVEDLAHCEDRVDVTDRQVDVCEQALKEAFAAVRFQGSRSQKARLPGLRDAALEARIASREARARHATARRDVAVAKKRDATVMFDLPAEVRYRCVAAGEARAAARLAREQRLAWLTGLGGEDHVRRLAACEPSPEDGSRGNELARLSKEQYASLVALDRRAAATAKRRDEAETALERVVAELEDELTKAEDEERARCARPSSLLEPTDEERAEDAREDEYRAYEEMLFARQFVPPEFLPSLRAEIRAEAKTRADAAHKAALLAAGAALESTSTPAEDDEDESDVAVVESTEGETNHPRRRPSPRPRPVLLLIARDVAAAAKARLLTQTTAQLEGLFVRVDATDAPFGLDALAFQAPLSVGQSVLAEVDAGLCYNTRVAFLDALTLSKAALIPTPRVVLVLGDARNRSGPPMPAPANHFGTGLEDLAHMADRELKEHYEGAAENLADLSTTRALEAFLDLADLQYPPSRGYALVLEAAIVLLQKTKRFRSPSESVTSVSWTAARRLLGHPVELVARFRDLDPATLPPETLIILREYKADDAWPKEDHEPTTIQEEENDDDDDDDQSSTSTGSSTWTETPSAPPADWRHTAAIGPLIRWIDAVVKASDYLCAHGGSAPVVSRHEPHDLVDGVVTVADGHDVTDEDSEATPRGWRAAFARLADSALEDCRGYRCAARLASTAVIGAYGARSAETVYNISVSHDCGRIFFTAYDPTSSVTLFTSIHEREVNGLLAPNSVERSLHGGDAAPATLQDMYARLVALLVVERGTGAPVASSALTYASEDQCRLIGKPLFVPQGSKSPPRLLCRRKLHRLLRETRRVSGYLATVTAYEEARGELRFHAYLPERAANLEVRVDAKTLNKTYVDADRHLGELDAVESRGASAMLEYLTDRLEVVPGKAQAEDMDGLRYLTTSGSSSSSSLEARSSGFRLRVRTCQGAGRRLYRLPVWITGATRPFLLSVYDATSVDSGRILRIRLYDPVFSEERELRLTRTHRALLLDSIACDWKSWHGALARRLSLLRKRRRFPSSASSSSVPPSPAVFEAGGLGIDATVFRGVVVIDGLPARAKVELLPGPGEALLVNVFDVSLRQKKKNASMQMTEYTVLIGQASLIAIWDLPESTETPVFDVLCGGARRTTVGFDEAQRKRGIDKLLGKFSRDPETGAVSLSKAIAATVVNRHAGTTTTTTFGRPPVAVVVAHDGTAPAVLRTRRQAPIQRHRTLKTDEDAYRRDLGALSSPGPAPAPQDDNDQAVVVNSSEALVEEKSAPDYDDAPAEAPSKAVKEERLIYQRGIRVAVQGQQGLAREVVFVKVFESFTAGFALRDLRFHIYRSSTARGESIAVTGLEALRGVLGSKAQHLLEPERQEEMLHFIVAEKLVLYEGVPEKGAYVEAGGRFTPKFEAQRLFDAALKLTPLNLGGDADAEANKDVLFDQADAAKKVRGRKILRQAQEVEGVVFHTTCFDMAESLTPDEKKKTSDPPPDNEKGPPLSLPPLRYVCYNPRAKQTQTLTIPPEALEEILDAMDDACPEAIKKPSERLRDPAKRFDLARAIAARFRLEYFQGAPPDLFLPWSKAEQRPYQGAATEEDRVGAPRHPLRRDRHTRPPEDRVLQRKNRILRRAATISGLEAILTIFAPENADLALDVNVYLTKLAESLELRLHATTQRQSFGRAYFDHSEGEPRDAYLSFLIRHLKVRGGFFDAQQQQQQQQQQKTGDVASVGAEEATTSAASVAEKKLRLVLEVDPKRPWLEAYRSLDCSIPVQENRPEGLPVRFVPADTRGDLVLRKGVALPHGGECIVTAYSRAPGEAANHGLVLEAYDTVTSYTAVLHVVASALLEIAHFDDTALQPNTIANTLETLLLPRLDVALAPGGALKLTITKKTLLMSQHDNNVPDHALDRDKDDDDKDDDVGEPTAADAA